MVSSEWAFFAHAMFVLHLHDSLLHSWYLSMEDIKRHYRNVKLSTGRSDLRQMGSCHLTRQSQRCVHPTGLPRRFCHCYRDLLNTMVHETTAKEKQICYNYVLVEDIHWFDLDVRLIFHPLAELLNPLIRHCPQPVQPLLLRWWQVTGWLYTS